MMAIKAMKAIELHFTDRDPKRLELEIDSMFLRVPRLRPGVGIVYLEFGAMAASQGGTKP